jgi:benzoate-CoA ligase
MDVEISFDIPEVFNMATVLVDRHVEEGRENRVALYSGDETITCGQLLTRVNKAGNMLRDAGIEIEDRVILYMADRPEFIESYVGAMKIGAVPIPINPVAPAEDLAYYLNDSRAAAVILDADLEDRLAQHGETFRYLKRVFVRGGPGGPSRAVLGPKSAVVSYADAFRSAPEELDPEPTSRDDPSYMFYTSGTTGRPKGTIHLHQDMVYCVRTWLANVSKPTEADLIYSASKLPIHYGLVNGLYQPLMAGIANVIVPEALTGAVAAQVVASTIERYRPTLLFWAPAGYNLVLQEYEARKVNPDLSSLRMCISAGEALPAAIYDRWKEAFGLELLDGIGSTEFGYIYIQNRPGRARPGSSGQVLPGYETKILDEDEKPVADGEIGELYMKSESFASWYWRKRDRSRDTFRGPWLKTGDRFTRDAEGYYYYQGRADDMIKTTSGWVSPIEVEGALLRHPAVAEVAVIGCNDADGLIKPKAFVVLKAGHASGTQLVAELQKHSQAELAPSFYKYPRWIDFVTALPKTAGGKIQRYQLRQPT